MSSYFGNPEVVTAVVAETPVAINVELGFTPAIVEVINVTNGARAVYHSQLTAGEILVTSLGGGTPAGALGKIGSGKGITPVRDTYGQKAGFTLGLLEDFNDTGADELHFICYGSAQ